MFSVIFDMDGTLLDTQRICIPAWEYAGKKQGLNGLGNDIQYVCGMNTLGWTGFLREHYPTLDIDKFSLDAHDFIEENLVIRFMKGAKDLLDFLKENGVKIGLASGSSKRSIEHHLKEVSATDYFTATVSGEEVENGKPAPDIFLLAAERLGAEPKDCFIFEDSANGIRSGFNAGMKCIAVPDIVDFDEEVSKLLFAKLTSLDEAIEIFKKL